MLPWAVPLLDNRRGIRLRITLFLPRDRISLDSNSLPLLRLARPGTWRPRFATFSRSERRRARLFRRRRDCVPRRGSGPRRPGRRGMGRYRPVPLLSPQLRACYPGPRSQWEGALIDETQSRGSPGLPFLRCADYTPAPRARPPIRRAGPPERLARAKAMDSRTAVASYVPPETPPCSESGDLETLSATLADRPGAARRSLGVCRR
jgi:hypothetical protein